MIPYYNIPEKNITELRPQGKGEKGLLLITSQHAFNSELHQKLSQIIKAIKYDLEVDCYLLHADDNGIPFSTFTEKYNCKDVIVFGAKPQKLMLNISAEYYRVLNFEKERILFSEPLAEMLNDKSKKLKFWNALQQMFL